MRETGSGNPPLKATQHIWTGTPCAQGDPFAVACTFSQPQEGKRRPGPIPQQIFDFAFTAARKNQERPVTPQLQLVMSHGKSETIINTGNGRSCGLNPSFPQQHSSCPLTSLLLRLPCDKRGACGGKGTSLGKWVSRPGLLERR